jgi:probable FeS assembly SUF system protein SufT
MMQQGEPVLLQRDVMAITIPMGDQVVLPESGEVMITQSLGGSFTVYYAGNLLRIAGDDADALGMEASKPPEIGEDADDDEIEDIVWEQMKTCYDPEIPINIVDLGLVYRCELRDVGEGKKDAYIDMTLTAPGCGMGDIIADDVRFKVEQVSRIRHAHVELVFDPPWSQEMMSEAARLQTGMM